MRLSSHLALHETHLKYSQIFKVAAIHFGTYVVPFGGTMCCRSLSSLFSADGREGDVFAFFWEYQSGGNVCACLCVGHSNNAADHGFARSKVFGNVLVVPLTLKGKYLESIGMPIALDSLGP